VGEQLEDGRASRLSRVRSGTCGGGPLGTHADFIPELTVLSSQRSTAGTVWGRRLVGSRTPSRIALDRTVMVP